MITPPAFQFYPKQWLADDNVMLMDWDARAMHLHFMCIAWQQQNPCTLPNDDELLKRWCNFPSDWERIKKQVFRAWKLDGDHWIQSGLLEVFLKQQAFSESRKQNALKREYKKTAPMLVHSTREKKMKKKNEEEDSSFLERFDSFYRNFWYPTDRVEALKAFRSIVVTDEVYELMLSQADRDRAEQLSRELNFRTKPGPWIRKRRWEDPQLPIPARNGNGNHYGNDKKQQENELFLKNMQYEGLIPKEMK